MPMATPNPEPVVPVLSRVTLVDRSAAPAAPGTAPAVANPSAEARTVSTFLPVSFTRGTLLGGLDRRPAGSRNRTRTRC